MSHRIQADAGGSIALQVWRLSEMLGPLCTLHLPASYAVEFMAAEQSPMSKRGGVKPAVLARA